MHKYYKLVSLSNVLYDKKYSTYILVWPSNGNSKGSTYIAIVPLTAFNTH